MNLTELSRCGELPLSARWFNELPFRQSADRGGVVFASHGRDGRALAGHDEAFKMVPSPGDGYEFWAMMK